MPLRYVFLLAFVLAACGDAPDSATPAPDSTRVAPPTVADPGNDLHPDDPIEDALPAPRFVLSGPTDTFSLFEHEGEIVVLHFWATWNELSQDGLFALDTLYAELAGDGVAFVGIAEDEDGMQPLRDWLAQGTALEFPVVVDTAGSVAEAYGEIDLFPTTVVIDRQGMIRARHTGILSSDAVLDLLGPILIEDDDPLSDFDAPAEPGVAQVIPVRAVPALIASGAMLVDIRPSDVHALDGAVPDAWHCPLARLSPHELPANFAVPVLFLGASEADTDRAAALALDWGYVTVYRVEGGVNAWREAGLPLKHLEPVAPAPIVRARTVLG